MLWLREAATFAAMKCGLRRFLGVESPVEARDERLMEGRRFLRVASACLAERKTSSWAAMRSGRREMSVAGRLTGMASFRFGNLLEAFSSAAGYLPSRDSRVRAALSR